MPQICRPRKIKFVAGLVAILAGVSFGSRHFSYAAPDQPQIRASEISLKLSTVRDPIVFIGDSITEGAPLPKEICGRPTIDAGISGLDAATYFFALRKIGNFRAAAIVVALGTNDARKDHDSDFAADYLKLVQALEPSSSKLILAGIPPLEDVPVVFELFDKARAERINKYIAAIAKQRGHRFVDLETALMSERRVTKDGVHLSSSGYALWVDAFRANVAAALGCTN